MKIFIASDHAGFELKNYLVDFLINLDYEIVDCGPKEYQSQDDYNGYARQVVNRILADKAKSSFGILICGTGTGMCIQANRFIGIRAVEACSVKQAILAREHNNSNIICLGSQIVSPEDNLQILTAWLGAKFNTNPKYQHRNDLLDE